MIGTLLDPNMCLSGPKRPFGGPKTDQILIFGPKRVCFEFGGLNIAKLIYYLVLSLCLKGAGTCIKLVYFQGFQQYMITRDQYGSGGLCFKGAKDSLTYLNTFEDKCRG